MFDFRFRLIHCWKLKKILNYKDGLFSESILTCVPLPSKGAKLLLWAENLNKLFTVKGGKFKFSVHFPAPFVGNWTKVKMGNEPSAKSDAPTFYPFNHVHESESGHISEIDDSPGSERLFTQHMSGTFEEIHPDGTKVVKIIGDNYEIIAGSSNVIISGAVNLTVEGSVRELIKGDYVVVPSTTFISVATPILQLGLIPLYVDVDRYTLNLDLNELEGAIKSYKPKCRFL